MLPIICLQFAKQLQDTYAPKNKQEVKIPQFTEQEIEKHGQTLKEQTQKYNERKKRKEQKFTKLNKEQITQLVIMLKQDSNFLNQLSSGIIKHTEIAYLIKKTHTLKAMKQLNQLAQEFKQNITIKIMNIFVQQQNKMYTKLQKYLVEKQQLLFDVLEKKLSQKFEYNEILKQQLLAQLNKILKLQVEDQCRKYAQTIGQQLVLMYEGITQLVGQHIESNKDNKLESELYNQIQKVREYFTSTEQLFIKRLQIDMSEYYGNAIQLILQIQQKQKQ